MVSKNLFVFVLAVLLSINHRCLARESRPTAENSKSSFNFLECFATQNENLDLPNEADVSEVLNEEAGAGLFVKSKNGLKVDTKVFSSLLSDCLKSNIGKLSNNGGQKDVLQLLAGKNQLQSFADFVFADKEVSINDIESLIKSRSTRRSKRDTAAFPLNIVQEILLQLVINPLKGTVNQILDEVIKGFSNYATPSNDAQGIQGAVAQLIGTAANTVIRIVTNLQNTINSIIDGISSSNGTPSSTNSTDSASNSTQKMSNTLVRSNARDLGFPFNVISDLLENTIIGPIRTTVNKILLTLKSTIYSFYTAETSNNPIQSVLNDIVNGVVLSSVKIIDAVYVQFNSILNNISSASNSISPTA